MANRGIYAHNQAINRLLIQGDLVLTDALHIGSGVGNLDTDAPVIMSAGKPIIPGSSLRGVLRSGLERTLAGLHQLGATPYWACGLYEPELDKNRICIGNLQHEQSRIAEQALQEKEEKDGVAAVWMELPKYLCDACRLFGAGSWLASRLRFTDLSIQGEYAIDLRHGVGIHRDTGTAAPTIKFDQQVVCSGAIFRMKIVAENLDDIDKGLLALMLAPLCRGEVALGGSTNRGLGTCKLDDQAKVYTLDLQDQENKVKLIEYAMSTNQNQEALYPESETVTSFVSQWASHLFPKAD